MGRIVPGVILATRSHLYAIPRVNLMYGSDCPKCVPSHPEPFLCDLKGEYNVWVGLSQVWN